MSLLLNALAALIPLAVITAIVVFMAGGLYIPIGYDRGRVKYFTWCATGQHPMIVYRWTAEESEDNWSRFQSLHPADKGDDADG